MIELVGSNHSREAGNGKLPVKRFSTSLQQVQFSSLFRQVETQILVLLKRKPNLKPARGEKQIATVRSNQGISEVGEQLKKISKFRIISTPRGVKNVGGPRPVRVEELCEKRK